MSGFIKSLSSVSEVRDREYGDAKRNPGGERYRHPKDSVGISCEVLLSC
jgi:hypothetical protein